METMELKLNSPITKEQWELITDANLEHSDTMWFDTPNGNHFEYKKVKHGRFIGTEYDGYADGNPVYYEWKCSACGCVFEDDEPTYHYCPNCGARMESE